LFKLVEEVFFNSPMVFESFEDFENRIIGATHTHHKLSAELHALVKQRFMAHERDGGAYFEMPIRVDLLEKI
jgi:hypothetical protein